MLRAGVTEVCITPPIGVELAGYGPRLDRYSSDIRDPLMAQALVLDDGHTPVAIVTCDLIGVSAEMVNTVREGVANRTRIPPENILIAASHSHTAPTAAPFRDWGSPDRSYIQMVSRHVTGAVVASAGKLKPARLSVGRTEHPDLAWNRVGRGGVDATVEAIRIDTEAGEPLAILVHYACHPVILGPKSEISADYPGALRRSLAARYPGAIILFLNGACGEIDPVTNKAVWGQGTFDDVEQAGIGLGDAARRALRDAERLENPKLHVRRSALKLDYNVPTLEAAREAIRRYAAEAKAMGPRRERFEAVTGEPQIPRFWLRYYRSLERQLLNRTVPQSGEAELQVIRFGGSVALVGIPAEVFTPQGMAIRANSPFPHTLPVCYANGLYGYFPPQSEFDAGAYSTRIAAAAYDSPPFQPGIAERLVEAVSQLLSD